MICFYGDIPIIVEVLNLVQNRMPESNLQDMKQVQEHVRNVFVLSSATYESQIFRNMHQNGSDFSNKSYTEKLIVVSHLLCYTPLLATSLFIKHLYY